MLTWQQARRVLCVRLDNMGDVLMTTPAMQALAESVPGRSLTLLTSRASAMLAPHLPMIDDVIAWDAPWVRHAHDGDGMAAAIGEGVAQIAAQSFDAAAIFTVYSQSALPAAMLCGMAGIPLRLAHCRENPYALLTDWVPDTEPDTRTDAPPRHEAQRQLDLVAQVGAVTGDPRLRFLLTDADRAMAGGLLTDLAGKHRAAVRVVVHPGATAASRRWPAERFADVARELAIGVGALVLVTGNGGERSLVEEVCRRAGHPAVVPMADRLSIGEMGALLSASDLLVSNNSGPVHMAAALGTPVVDLYALTNPQHTPWMVPHRVLFQDVPCRYCYKSACPQGHHRCLREVSVLQVVEASMALLDGEAGARTTMPWACHARQVPMPPPVSSGQEMPVQAIAKEDVHVHARH